MSTQQFPQGPRYKFRNQQFWAEGGLICIENQLDGNFKAITRAEAVARAICLNDELKFMDYPDERDELCKCVVNLGEAVKEAKRQGDPTNPDVRKQLIKDRKKVSVLFSTSGPTSQEVLNSNKPSIIQGTMIGNKMSGRLSSRFNKLEL